METYQTVSIKSKRKQGRFINSLRGNSGKNHISIALFLLDAGASLECGALAPLLAALPEKSLPDFFLLHREERYTDFEAKPLLAKAPTGGALQKRAQFKLNRYP